MTYHAASREALAATEQKLSDVLGKPARGRAKATAAPAEQLGDELFAVVRLLNREASLRRALGDSSAGAGARESLLTNLLDGKVSAQTMDVIRTAVTSRWSTPRELVDGLDEVGRTAFLIHAERAGHLDGIEDELFRFSRIVAAEANLEQALADRNALDSAKLELIGQLLGSKADAITVKLVEQLVLVPRGRSIVGGLGELAAEAAKRRERSVAYVVSASPLTEAQQERLSTTLERIYARPIALHVEVDPSIQGGLVVKVGDEVIDGSATGRIDELRRRLAG